MTAPFLMRELKLDTADSSIPLSAFFRTDSPVRKPLAMPRTACFWVAPMRLGSGCVW
jgi:hypothetical protein